MSATLFSGMYTPAAASASSAAANYPASAAMVPGVSRGWQSSSGGLQWLQFDLGANVSVHGVALQAITYQGTGITVLADTSNPPVTNRGTLATGLDANGRTKGSLSFGAASIRYVRFNFTSTVGVCGAASGFVFASAAALARDALYGQTRITLIDPQVRNELPNGVVETYSAGAPSTEIDLSFRGTANDDIEALKRLTRAGACWLDLGLPQRGRQWPVRNIESQTSRQLEGYNRESVNIPLREIT